MASISKSKPVHKVPDWKPPGPCTIAVHPDKLKVWEMKKPHPAELWIPNYPKRHSAKGPADEIPPGVFRIGPDRVGPVCEFMERRVRCFRALRFHFLSYPEETNSILFRSIFVDKPEVMNTWRSSALEYFLVMGRRHAGTLSDPRKALFDKLISSRRVAQRLAGAAPTCAEDKSRAASPRLTGVRLSAVRSTFEGMDDDGDGKIEIKVSRHRMLCSLFAEVNSATALVRLAQDLLQRLQVDRYRKGLDFFRIDDVVRAEFSICSFMALALF